MTFTKNRSVVILLESKSVFDWVNYYHPPLLLIEMSSSKFINEFNDSTHRAE